MKYIIAFIVSLIFISCSPEISKQTESKPIKVIEESNKFTKTMLEKDSFVVKTKDTIKVID